MPEIITKMFRLLYVSRSLARPRQSDIDAILNVSRRNNAKNRITGVLCVGAESFMQVLEGPEHHVIATYAGIVEDPRHTDCAIVNAIPATSRMFKEWSMGFIDTETGAPSLLEMAAKLRAVAERQDRTVSIMRELLQARRGRADTNPRQKGPVLELDEAGEVMAAGSVP